MEKSADKKILKRINYKKIGKALEERGYDPYIASNQDINIEGATSGITGIKPDGNFSLYASKHKGENIYLIEIESDDEEMVQIAKDYFAQYQNIEKINVNKN